MCCVFDSVCGIVCETIRNMFVILLLNVMELLSVAEGALLDIPMYCLPKKLCVVPVVPVSV